MDLYKTKKNGIAQGCSKRGPKFIIFIYHHHNYHFHHHQLLNVLSSPDRGVSLVSLTNDQSQRRFHQLGHYSRLNLDASHNFHLDCFS